MKTTLTRNSLFVVVLLLLSTCGGGGGGDSTLTKADLFTRMIGTYQVEWVGYLNDEVTGSGGPSCSELEPYDTWWYFFDDMTGDQAKEGFIDSSLRYTSNSIFYMFSWEEQQGVICTETEEYVFMNMGASYTRTNIIDCDGDVTKFVENGVRLGALDTPNDLVNAAVPLPPDTPLLVTLGPGDWDFFRFTQAVQATPVFSVTDISGTLSGLNYSFYSGTEDYVPDGGGGMSIPPIELEPNTYYLALRSRGCTESGTFTLTMLQP